LNRHPDAEPLGLRFPSLARRFDKLSFGGGKELKPGPSFK
jgi:hypothetical protein